MLILVGLALILAWQFIQAILLVLALVVILKPMHKSSLSWLSPSLPF
jgi:hypothetical protein